MDISRDKLLETKKLCHLFCIQQCVAQKRQELYKDLLCQRPHWSVLKKDEQNILIDQGEKFAFDIALPLPARDLRPESELGIKLFWEKFSCQLCGRCCYTPGAGIILENEDFNRIGKQVGKNRLRRLCKHEKQHDAWILKQPCPFYNNIKKGCNIYEIRPATCKKYPLHPPLEDMPFNLSVDAFCPAAREFAKETLSWWIVCENNWAALLKSKISPFKASFFQSNNL